MKSLDNSIFLVLDIGTSDIKCGCVDIKNKVIARYQRQFPMEKRGNLFEIDFNFFFETTNELISECLFDKSVKQHNVKALLITSQAQTFTPVDENFSPLQKGIVWLDERAKEEADYLKKHLPNFASTSGFASPISSLYISKLLWLKRNKKNIFDKARAFPLINEYLVYKLTGQFYSDKVSFGISGMFDFNRNTINHNMMEILELSEKYFPKVENPTTNGELVSKQILNNWKLDYDLPVFLCGNDQGASACGAGLKKSGDININFGTAMVFYTITDSLITKLTESQIAGKHPIGDYYFLLNLENDYGIQIRRLKNLFFKNGTYDELFQTYNKYPEVNAKAPLFEDAELNSISSTIEAHKLCSAVIKYYLQRLKVHFTQIQDVVTLNNISLSGGMLKSKVWIEILHDNLIQPFNINNRTDAGLFGAIEIFLNNNRIN